MSQERIQIPLELGPLRAEGHDVQRSGIRWLVEDGHCCQPGEVIACCHIGLAPRPGIPRTGNPFQEETRDFSVALAPALSGRLMHADNVSKGGFFDINEWHHPWVEGARIGQLECSAEDVEQMGQASAQQLRMLLLNGRRVVGTAGGPAGLLTGWHDRCRAWWGGQGLFGNLLSLGICEQIGIIRGEQWVFLELFKDVAGPVHVSFIPDNVLVPCAPVLYSGLLRTQAEYERIVEDAMAMLGRAVSTRIGTSTQGITDWIHLGSILKALSRSPLLEPSEILTATGVQTLGPPDAVLLSLNSEGAPLLRHKRLGYLLSMHGFRLSEMGPVLSSWFRQEFEMIHRTLDLIKRDYLKLIDLIQQKINSHVLILNRMSTSRFEQCICYAPFDKPLGNSLPQIRTQERNLMLYEVAHERDISLVDMDAIAADLGGVYHIPDGTHASGRLQRALRDWIVTILRERGMAGFQAAR